MLNQRQSAAVRRPRTGLQRAALAAGAVFVVVGALGFVPGVTAGYDASTFASHHSGALLFGVFQVSGLHNIVHLLFGAAGLICARAVPAAAGYLVGGGLLYLALAIYGYVVPQHSTANFMPVNPADDVLHLVFSVAMIVSGLVLASRVPEPATREGGPAVSSRSPQR